MNKGTFCLSIDTELLWGRHAYKYTNFIPRVEKEREIINRLLFLLTSLNLSATWAIVGHLFLSSCSKKNGKKHQEITAPSCMLGKRDWFDLDPCTSLEKDPCWYGKDIVEKIKKNKDQEIASHSFSHMLFTDPACTNACASSDIAACVELAKKEGVRLDSFVFPVNHVGHLAILKNNNFICFRGPDQFWYKGRNVFLQKLLLALDLFLPITPSVTEITKQSGLVAIAGSMYFVSARGIRKFIPKGVRYNKAKRGIDAAIAQKKIFHLWMHPTDLVDNTQDLFDDLEKILSYAKKKEEEGLLTIKTMSQIAKDNL